MVELLHGMLLNYLSSNIFEYYMKNSTKLLVISVSAVIALWAGPVLAAFGDECVDSPWTPIYSIQNITCDDDCGVLRIVDSNNTDTIYYEAEGYTDVAEQGRDELRITISDACALPKVTFSFDGEMNEEQVEFQETVDKWDIGMDRQVIIEVGELKLDIRVRNSNHVNKFWYAVVGITVISIITLIVTGLIKRKQKS